MPRICPTGFIADRVTGRRKNRAASLQKFSASYFLNARVEMCAAADFKPPCAGLCGGDEVRRRISCSPAGKLVATRGRGDGAHRRGGAATKPSSGGSPTRSGGACFAGGERECGGLGSFFFRSARVVKHRVWVRPRGGSLTINKRIEKGRGVYLFGLESLKLGKHLSGVLFRMCGRRRCFGKSLQ